jgi:hypothetical protein
MEGIIESQQLELSPAIGEYRKKGFFKNRRSLKEFLGKIGP